MTSLQPSREEPVHLGGDPYCTQCIGKFDKAEGRGAAFNNIKEACKVTTSIPFSCSVHAFSTRRCFIRIQGYIPLFGVCLQHC